MEKAMKRHKLIFALVRPFVFLFVWLKFNFKISKSIALEGPFLIISNHVTDFDMLMVALSFKQHMYFVASEHSLRAGWASKLLTYFLDPIGRAKGTVAASTVINMKRRIKSGANICIFAEGGRSFNGCSGKIQSATAAVVKRMGIKLVTFRLHGGYFSSPRWSLYSRRGKMSGEMIHIYEPEEMQAMSDKELDAAINRDIYEDAYAENSLSAIPYKGKALAEGIEYELVICPKCNNMNTLHSKGNTFACSCGLHGQIDAFGMLSGDGFSFKTVTQWDQWEQQVIAQLPINQKDTVFCRDPHQHLTEIAADHSTRSIDSGDLVLTNKALSVGKTDIPLEMISRYDLILRGYILISTKDGRHYEIRNSKQKYAGRLYILLLDRLLKTKVLTE